MGGKVAKKKEKFVLSYTNGDKYEGDVVDGIREGKGTYFYHNGDKYEGMWSNNNKHGMGTLYYKDGNLYVGQWKNSHKDGLGKMYYKHGEKYFGEFKSNNKCGNGTLISRDRSMFTGSFLDNKKHGSGVITYSNGKKANELWENGILVSSSSTTTNSPKRELTSGNFAGKERGINLKNDAGEKYVDNSFENFIEEQTHHDSNKQSYKQFTLEVAKYFKSKIPNNYFDSSHLFLLTNDIIFENPSIIDWSNSTVCKWITRLGLEKYVKSFQKSNLDGNSFLLLSIPELQNKLDIKDIKDIKLIFKSIDFLRIYLKLKLDFQEYIDVEKKNQNLLFLKREDHELNTGSVGHKDSIRTYEKKKTIDDTVNIPDKLQDKTDESKSTAQGGANSLIELRRPNKEVSNLLRDDQQVINLNKLTEDNLVMEHNQEFYTTKLSLTELMLHSLNLSGFNFFIKFEEIKISNKIGEGGFGEVFYGGWNGKNIAIKKFNIKDKANLKHTLNKFIREINIISNLRHPNIVLYMGASLHKNNYYMISEYVSKGSLFDYLHIKKGSFNENEQIMIAYEMAVAIQYLHSRRILHCDLKSSNILLDEDLKIKISDFGLSRIKNLFLENENKGRIGTPHWMAPEIMKESKYEESSDVFSYGMILWELLANEIPYYGLTAFQIIAIVSDFGKIVEAPNEGHPALRLIIKGCLNYEPSKRPKLEEIIIYLKKVLMKTKKDDYVSSEIYNFLS